LAAVLLHDLLDAAAHHAPDRLALVTDAGAVTFAVLRARTEIVAAGLAALTEPGDRVAILAENRAEYVECYYAVPRAGRVLVPLNHRLHAEEWRAALTRSGARVLIAEPELLDRLGARAARDAGVATIVGLDGVEADVDYPSLDGPALPSAADRRADDVTWLVGTSGTTGTPKLAMLTHSGLLAAVRATLAARPVGPGDTLLTPFPLCHVAGYNVLVLHHAARPIVVMRRFDVDRLLTLVTEHDVTMLSVAPTMIAMLLADERVDPVLRHVRAIGYGASAVPAPVLRAAVERWGVDLSQGYGMTELSGNAVFLGPDEHRAAAAGDARLLGAAGYAAPGVEVRLDDVTGEILVRAPQVMAGYWEDPAATAAALTGGRLHTGDVGRLDDDGLLTVVDRLKDVIVSGGENVASRDVEVVLHTHPGVADVAVIGLPDEQWGERVTAVVVRRDGATVTDTELIALSRSHLAGYKTPRAVVFVDELPRNAAGKVLKQQLRADLGQLRDAP
jgi:acyl-CoA synthetase (AMP-forming)/AMP-acid ligase II